MDNELFIYFTTDNISGKKSNQKWLKKNNTILYDIIIEWCLLHDTLYNIPFKQKVYHYIFNTTEIPVCKECGGSVKYTRLKQGYSDYCSDKCTKKSTIYKEKWKKSWHINNDDGESISKRNDSIINKYGDMGKYNEHLNEKRKEGCIKKHGKEYYFQTDEFKNIRKETLIGKHGDKHFNNPSKTKNTRIKNGTQLNDNLSIYFKYYRKILINRTNTIYRNNKYTINPTDLLRGQKTYHLDHRYSIKQGFIDNLPIEIMSHPCNLQMVYYKDNLIKQDTCSITLKQLLDNIISFDENINFTNNELKNTYSNVKNISQMLLEKLNK